jgi:hypothetical protein
MTDFALEPKTVLIEMEEKGNRKYATAADELKEFY